jgi:hypothetical protein
MDQAKAVDDLLQTYTMRLKVCDLLPFFLSQKFVNVLIETFIQNISDHFVLGKAYGV